MPKTQKLETTISFTAKQIQALIIGLDIAAAVLKRLEKLSAMGLPLPLRGSREVQALRDALLAPLEKLRKINGKINGKHHEKTS